MAAWGIRVGFRIKLQFHFRVSIRFRVRYLVLMVRNRVRGWGMYGHQWASSQREKYQCASVCVCGVCMCKRDSWSLLHCGLFSYGLWAKKGSIQTCRHLWQSAIMHFIDYMFIYKWCWFCLDSYFKRHSREFNVVLSCFSCGVIQVSISLCSHRVFSLNVSFILLGVVFRCAQDQQKPVKAMLNTESRFVAIFLTQEFSCC